MSDHSRQRQVCIAGYQVEPLLCAGRTLASIGATYVESTNRVTFVAPYPQHVEVFVDHATVDVWYVVNSDRLTAGAYEAVTFGSSGKTATMTAKAVGSFGYSIEIVVSGNNTTLHATISSTAIKIFLATISAGSASSTITSALSVLAAKTAVNAVVAFTKVGTGSWTKAVAAATASGGYVADSELARAAVITTANTGTTGNRFKLMARSVTPIEMGNGVRDIIFEGVGTASSVCVSGWREAEQ